jgi:hypothetical protein
MAYIRPWKYIERDGEKYFQYMLTHNLSSSSTINHFSIHYACTYADHYYKQIDDSYRVEVEPLLAAWIQKEDRDGRLKDRSLWRPFRDDVYEGMDTMMCYRHLFPFTPMHPPLHPEWKDGETRDGPEERPLEDGTYPHLVRIYFMLTLIWGCRDCRTCKGDYTETIHFVAGLYGWEESDTPYLKPHYYYIQPYETQRQDIECKIIDRIWFAPPDNEEDDSDWSSEEDWSSDDV